MSLQPNPTSTASDTDHGASTDRSMMSSEHPQIAVCPTAPVDHPDSHLMESAVDVNPDSGTETSEGPNKTFDDLDSTRQPLAYATVESSIAPVMTTDESDGHATSDGDQGRPVARLLAVHQHDISEDVSSQGRSYTEQVTDGEPVTTEGEVTEGLTSGTEDATETDMEHTDGEEPLDNTDGEEPMDNTDGEEPMDHTTDDDRNHTTESEGMSSEEEDEDENVDQVQQGSTQQQPTPVSRVLAVGSTTAGSNVVLPMSVAVGGVAAATAGIATATALRSASASQTSTSMTYTSNAGYTSNATHISPNAGYTSGAGYTSNTTQISPNYSTSFGNASFGNPTPFRAVDSPNNLRSSQFVTNSSITSVPSSLLNGHHTMTSTSYPMTTSSVNESSKFISSSPSIGQYQFSSSSMGPSTTITQRGLSMTQQPPSMTQQPPSMMQQNASMMQQNASSTSWSTSPASAIPTTIMRPTHSTQTSTTMMPTSQNSSFVSGSSFQPSTMTNVTTTSYSGNGSSTRLPVSASLPLSSVAKPTVSMSNTPSTALTTPAAIGNTYPSMTTMTGQQHYTGSMTTSAQRGTSTSVSPITYVQRQRSHESAASHAVSHAASQISRAMPTTTTAPITTTMMTSTPQTTPARVWTTKPDDMMNATTSAAAGSQTTPHVVYANTRNVSTTSGMNRNVMSYSAPMQSTTMGASFQPLATSTLAVEPSHFAMPSHQISAAAPFMTASMDNQYHPAAPYMSYQPIMPAVTASISHPSMIDAQETADELIKTTSRGDGEMKSHHKHHKHSRINKKNRCSCAC